MTAVILRMYRNEKVPVSDFKHRNIRIVKSKHEFRRTDVWASCLVVRNVIVSVYILQTIAIRQGEIKTNTI